MIEDEIRQEILDEQADKLSDGEYILPKEKCENDCQNPEEKCKVGNLFPKEEWDSLIKWRPVSNIPVEEIYKDLPEAKQFHENYVSLWGLRTKKDGR